MRTWMIWSNFLIDSRLGPGAGVSEPSVSRPSRRVVMSRLLRGRSLGLFVRAGFV